MVKSITANKSKQVLKNNAIKYILSLHALFIHLKLCKLSQICIWIITEVSGLSIMTTHFHIHGRAVKAKNSIPWIASEDNDLKFNKA